jgi:hypothetical protein
MSYQTNKPLLPPTARSRAPAMIRAATANLLAFREAGQHSDAAIAAVAKRDYAGDREVEALTRAVSPASTATDPQFTSTAVPDFILSMGGAASGMLNKSGIRLTFDGTSAFQIPNLLASANNATFVEQGAPIPCRDFSIDSKTLARRKLGTLSVFNSESFAHSVPAVEKLVGVALTESCPLTFDAAMFDATAGSETRPAGLLLNIDATAASAKTASDEAMSEDVSNVVGKVSTVASSSPIILVCAPKQAVALRLRSRAALYYDILPSSALSDGTLIAIAANALACAVDPHPRLQTGNEGAITLDSDGKNYLDGPTISLFQSDRISLRLIFEVAWALRSAGGLAWIENATWGGTAPA